jgi:hypothetical protein
VIAEVCCAAAGHWEGIERRKQVEGDSGEGRGGSGVEKGARGVACSGQKGRAVEGVISWGWVKSRGAGSFTLFNAWAGESQYWSTLGCAFLVC